MHEVYSTPGALVSRVIHPRSSREQLLLPDVDLSEVRVTGVVLMSQAKAFRLLP